MIFNGFLNFAVQFRAFPFRASSLEVSLLVVQSVFVWSVVSGCSTHFHLECLFWLFRHLLVRLSRSESGSTDAAKLINQTFERETSSIGRQTLKSIFASIMVINLAKFIGSTWWAQIAQCICSPSYLPKRTSTKVFTSLKRPTESPNKR